jgi:hypothetical protein
MPATAAPSAGQGVVARFNKSSDLCGKGKSRPERSLIPLSRLARGRPVGSHLRCSFGRRADAL